MKKILLIAAIICITAPLCLARQHNTYSSTSASGSYPSTTAAKTAAGTVFVDKDGTKTMVTDEDMAATTAAKKAEMDATGAVKGATRTAGYTGDNGNLKSNFGRHNSANVSPSYSRHNYR